ncbi:hypothetical protein A167_02038 [Alcanivorax sp. S71-1-4]|nr:hypothetical protein A167_02038 [Alcanivorax sp. S71-1-4]
MSAGAPAGRVGRAHGETHRDHAAHCSHRIIETARLPSWVISMVLREWIPGMGMVGFAVGSTHPTVALAGGVAMRVDVPMSERCVAEASVRLK